MSNHWDIIYTYHHKAIHLKHLIKHNPNDNILLANINYDVPNKKYAWRNYDNLIRLWLKENISKITSDRIAILQWDVLATKKLPDICPDGLVVSNIQIPHTRPWVWFKEASSLGKYGDYALGVTPLAFLMMNKECLEEFIHPRYDDIFSKDIFCELRLGTILHYADIPITKFNMPNLTEFIVTPSDIPDYYHSVTTEYNDSSTVS